MNSGKILVSDQLGNHLLKFTGDVRVTLCGTLNRYIESIFGCKNVKRVVVDMLEAEGLDSTTLGLLAKLGLHCRQRYGLNIEVFCQNSSILRTLESMSFDEIFDIFDQLPDFDSNTDFHEIGAQDLPVDELRQQVLEAHKILVRLSDDNQQEFQDLIKALESGD
ncbi:STAS domain-containing protein [Gammaproteobacteria bacterium]|nr:STAS domain-containing protein [Gammaproteobacteria bacterium]